MIISMLLFFFVSSRRRHTRCALVTGFRRVLFRSQANLVKITPLTVPIDALKNLTYSAQLMPGRALALVSMVEQALTELAYAIQVRQEKVDQFRAEETSVEVTTQAYFGLKRRDGNTDSLYHDSMVAITQYTDDIAFFSAEIGRAHV